MPSSGTVISPGQRSRIAPHLVMVVICLGFFALWLRDLGYPSLSGDESFVATLARQPTREILQRLNEDEPHPPLYYLLMHAWYVAAGSRPEFLVRFPSLLIGLLLLSLTYRLARDIGLRWPAALIAVFAVGLNPQVVMHVREARMYGPMIASLAFAALIALRFDRLPRRAAIGVAAVARRCVIRRFDAAGGLVRSRYVEAVSGRRSERGASCRRCRVAASGRCESWPICPLN